MQSIGTPPPNVGGYRLVREIGRGGMSVVYLAENEVLQRRAAVKMLHPAMSRDLAHMQRLLAEARIVASLQHPGIVQVFDIARLADSQLYMVLEYVDGVSLAQRLSEGRLPRATCFEILRQLCAAVEAAHAVGVVHRDIKAENVMLTGDPLSPRIKLLDFGLARAAIEQDSAHAGFVVGTPHYMAPEQIRGDAVDARTDVYALGVLAYFLFTGQLPFVGAAEEILYLQTHVMPGPPPELPTTLWNIVAKAIAKAPEARFPSARALSDAIEKLIEEDFAPSEEDCGIEVSGPSIVVRCSSADAWEKLWREQVAHRRLFVPHRELPTGMLRLCFEVNGAAVFEAEAEVSLRLTPEQARPLGTPPGCALVLRRARAAPIEAESDRLICALHERRERDHYAFLDVPPDADSAAIFRCCEVLRERLESVPPRSPLRAQADRAYQKLQQARRDLCDLEARAAYDAELGNHRGVASALRTGLSPERLARMRTEYAQRHPERVARATSLLLESDRCVAQARAARGVTLLQQALTLDPLSMELHRRLLASQRAA
jgi:serine/threonine-protein kinase